MRRTVWAVLAMVLTAHLAGPAAGAEGETESRPASDAQEISTPKPAVPVKGQPSPEEVRRMMQGMLGSMADLMGLMMEGMAKTMAKPEIAENFATFTRNYYDALITRGFTEEQALKIITSNGLPSLGGKR